MSNQTHFNKITNAFHGPSLTAEQIADILSVTPEAVASFEKAYQTHILDADYTDGGFFDLCKKQIKSLMPKKEQPLDDALIDRIVKELMTSLVTLRVTNDNGLEYNEQFDANPPAVYITNDEVKQLPKEQRPQLTGKLIKKDIEAMSYHMVLSMYDRFLHGKTPQERKMGYNLFRQGVDMLDLDPVLYEILGQNPASMGYWLSQIVEPVKKHGFFKIPNTTIIRVPLPILQLSRLDYESISPMSFAIVNRFCEKAFDLDYEKEYFVKTGIFSSKFDFRNTHVHGESEVKTLGEYLLFITHQSVELASPLMKPTMYGAATTNEWVVREFIPDVEGNPTIYKGLPLRTEYRVFVDFDTNEVLACCNYWDPDLLKKRFSQDYDKNSPHQKHDYVIIQTHEAHMDYQFKQHKDKIIKEIEKLLPDSTLQGQWSIDIMKNGDDFYLIDMAPAETSALYDRVPKEKRNPVLEPAWVSQLFTKENKNLLPT